MCSVSSESPLIHCYEDSISAETPSPSFPRFALPFAQNRRHLFVSPSVSGRGRDSLDFPTASLSLPLIAVGITGCQGQNGLQRLWFHCCFPNWLFSPCACSPSTPKFPHLPPSHPTPRPGNGIRKTRAPLHR